MHVRRQEGKVLLQVNFLEAQILHRILSVIVENYKATPFDLDPATAEVWYSTRGCESAHMSAEETREWLAALHQVKSASLQQLDAWTGTLRQFSPSGHQLALDLPEAETLLRVLNDFRLMTAARHNIGESEMSLRSDDSISDLPPARRTALIEIHLLAWIMEEILAALSEN